MPSCTSAFVNGASIRKSNGWPEIVWTCEYRTTSVVRSVKRRWTERGIGAFGLTHPVGQPTRSMCLFTSQPTQEPTCATRRSLKRSSRSRNPRKSLCPRLVYLFISPIRTVCRSKQARRSQQHVLAFLLHPTPKVPVHVVAGYLSDGTGKHLIAKRSPGEFDAGSWEFPGGKIEEGESWAASVERELREELRLDVTGRQLLGTVVRDVGTTTYAVHLVRCDWSGALDRLGLDVHDAVAWVDVTDSDRPWAGRDAEFHSLIGDLTHNQVEASPSSVIARSSLMERGT